MTQVEEKETMANNTITPESLFLLLLLGLLLLLSGSPILVKAWQPQQHQQHHRHSSSSITTITGSSISVADDETLSVAAGLSTRRSLGQRILRQACGGILAGIVGIGGSGGAARNSPAAGAADAAATDVLVDSKNNNKLALRFEQDNLQQLPVGLASSNAVGIDNTYYPSWLEGTWETTQTLVNVQAPLGFKYMGGPNGVESIGQKSFDESKLRLNEPVTLRLRYVPTKWGVVEDRIYNTAQRLNAFAGRTVVASVNYADTSASNRDSVLKNGGTSQDPLQTVFVRYKGPAQQKVFVTGHSSSSGDSSETPWYGYESQRSIFALTNESTSPPIFTDSESLWQFEQQQQRNPGIVDNTFIIKGRLRILGYLNAQSDKLYFDAKNRAVTIQDYDLYMKKIS